MAMTKNQLWEIDFAVKRATTEYECETPIFDNDGRIRNDSNWLRDYLLPALDRAGYKIVRNSRPDSDRLVRNDL
jgi:hypothetical protein